LPVGGPDQIHCVNPERRKLVAVAGVVAAVWLAVGVHHLTATHGSGVESSSTGTGQPAGQSGGAGGGGAGGGGGAAPAATPGAGGGGLTSNNSTGVGGVGGSGPGGTRAGSAIGLPDSTTQTPGPGAQPASGAAQTGGLVP
jgi:hypothetical protein